MGLSRFSYKKIKSMTREEMETHLESFYNEAFSEGVQKGLKLMEQLFIQGIEETPSIGPKRREQIFSKVNEKVEEYNNQLQGQSGGNNAHKGSTT